MGVEEVGDGNSLGDWTPLSVVDTSLSLKPNKININMIVFWYWALVPVYGKRWRLTHPLTLSLSVNQRTLLISMEYCRSGAGFLEPWMSRKIYFPDGAWPLMYASAPTSGSIILFRVHRSMSVASQTEPGRQEFFSFPSAMSSRRTSWASWFFLHYSWPCSGGMGKMCSSCSLTVGSVR